MDRDPFVGFPLQERIRDRAAACGVRLDQEVAQRLAEHARSVLLANEELHLTTITEPEEFLERHLGEAFEGARMLEDGVSGLMVDLGSGNGYPGLPVLAARGRMHLLLTEASAKKAQFLRQVLERGGWPGVEVHGSQVQRGSDIPGEEPIALLVSRAMGAWPKILPRFASRLAEDGQMLVWCGEEMESVSTRVVWRRLRIVERRPLPGRERSWIWRIQRAPGQTPASPQPSRADQA